MDFQSASNLLNSTYVLTNTEKCSLLQRFKDRDPVVVNMIENYAATQNVNAFFNELKERNLLSTQKYYSVSFTLLTQIGL